MTSHDPQRWPRGDSQWRPPRDADEVRENERVALLRRRLQRAAKGLGGEGSNAPIDADVLRALLDLYEEHDPTRVWRRFIVPFLDQHGDDLRVIYARDRSLPNPLLERSEGLLVLERLEHVPAQLAETWPGRWIELERLAQSWAIAIN